MITQDEYRLRRSKLIEKLPEGSLAIISSGTEKLRNGDAHYRFRQDSNFYYLTGFNEPNAVLLLLAGKQSKSYLFNQPRCIHEEKWTGKRLGQEDASQTLGIDEAFSIMEIERYLPNFFSGRTAVYYAKGSCINSEKIILKTLKQQKQQAHKKNFVIAQENLSPLLSEMRLIKSEAEIALMRVAADISVNAHKRAMQNCRKLNYEYQLEAELVYEFMRCGCSSPAYPSIVAAGGNATTLHYTDNNQPLQNGQLVLIDAAGEFANYAADITRTIPINGRYNKEQRLIYELVLNAQKAGISCIKPGTSWDTIQNAIVRVLTKGLCELGLLQGEVDVLIRKEAYKPFYSHNSGHWLGLDVHDCGAYKINSLPRTLQAGMVLTVEPGLYIDAGMEFVEPRFWNIGVRIEDDILVTEYGYENLTKNIPVEIVDIEAMMNG